MLNKSKFKYIQSLAHKKLRDEEQVFVAEGPKLVSELIKEGASLIEIFAVEEWMDENAGKLANTTVTLVDDAEMERLSLMSTPNKVVAIAEKFQSSVLNEVKSQLVLALDTIQNPGNFGSIVRIADWYGIKNIACSKECADLYNPKVVQATMGSLARVNVFYVSLVEWLEELGEKRIYATALEGHDITTMDPVREGIIVIGNESRGVNDSILRIANATVTIPKRGKADSLNAAVATGIVLSHLVGCEESLR